ncbi:MAG: hypothetical protein HXO64_07955 [Rothia mucilaginosa]|uniref:Uncharacterized protein n=1 Tax=Rothia mucilaginosa TaxID=43675 RepID=A0A930L605_9MICC|nr:hypothetical protein [Rothia mucilaginosa]MBF1664469.1 hypothetical protein [Rothia mucilaginosa]
MTIQKKVIISARRGLVEVTVCNRDEVVEYLQQHNWHLDRDVFIRVAPDEYCLIRKSALAPDMNVISEEVVRTWNTAETTELKELREYKKCGVWARGVLTIETAVLSVVFAAAVFFMWNHMDVPEWLIKACIVTSALTGVAVIDRRAIKDKETNRD